MGQYYQACIIEYDEKGNAHVVGWLQAFDFGFESGGLKLLGHSYKGNIFVEGVERLICREGPYYGYRIVWAGDYADAEPGTETNLYNMCDDSNHVHSETSTDLTGYHYLVNQSKKVFFDKRHWFYGERLSKLPYHLLPILTCDGNGRGGGDIQDAPDWVGSWAKDVVALENTPPQDDYTEMVIVLDGSNENLTWDQLKMVPFNSVNDVKI